MNYLQGRQLPIFLAVILIFLILGVQCYLPVQNPKEENPSQQTVTNRILDLSQPPSPIEPPAATQTPIESEEATSLTDIPPLYPGVDWQKKPTQKWVYPNSYFLSAGRGYIPLTSGNEWQANTDYLSNQEWSKLVEGFYLYYDVVNPSSVFPRRGWTRQVEAGGTLLKAPAADGPGGRFWGTIGVKDGGLRVAVFESDKISNQGQCPCKAAFTVFLSDVIPLDAIPSALNSN